MTVIEAAQKLGVSRSLLYQLIKERRLPHRRIGAAGRRGKILVDEADLKEFLDKMRVEGEA